MKSGLHLDSSAQSGAQLPKWLQDSNAFPGCIRNLAKTLSRSDTKFQSIERHRYGQDTDFLVDNDDERGMQSPGAYVLRAWSGWPDT